MIDLHEGVREIFLYAQDYLLEYYGKRRWRWAFRKMEDHRDKLERNRLIRSQQVATRTKCEQCSTLLAHTNRSGQVRRFCGSLCRNRFAAAEMRARALAKRIELGLPT